MWSTYLTSTESGHQYPGSASPEPSVSVNLLVAAQPQPAHHIPTSLHEPRRLVDGRSPRVGLSSRLLTRTCRLPCFLLPTSLILFFTPSTHSRSSSVNSHSPSLQSAAASTRYMLADMNSPLEPPSAPFASHRESTRSFSSGTSPLLKDSDKFSTSLSVNYLPSKFSNAVVTKRKKNGKANGGYLMPKQGGGREAFRSNEARMPGEGDDDYDGIDFNKEGGRTKAKGRWNKFKWCLFLANILVSSQIPSISPLSSFQLLSSSCRFVLVLPSCRAHVAYRTNYPPSSAHTPSQASSPASSSGSMSGPTPTSSASGTRPNS